MPFSILFYTFFASSIMLYSATTLEVSLGWNTHVNHSEKRIVLGANSFIDLISKGIFIDKTLLIDAILNNYSLFHTLGLTCPNQWGKTINFDMLKTFLSIQFHPDGTTMLPISNTPNYQLFTKGEYRRKNIHIKLQKPLLISNPKYKPIIDKYLGRHPVINLSFNGISTTAGKSDFDMLREIIANAFREHQYMLQIYDRIIENETSDEDHRTWAIKEKSEFLTYMNVETSKEFSLIGSIRSLSEKLRQYFLSKVFVLVDDYHQLLNTNVTETIENLLYFVNEDNDDVERTIFAGSLPIQLQSDPRLMEFLHTPLYPFCGFTKNEMNLVNQFYQINAEEQSKIRQWYGGYQTPVNLQDEVFNPWSICNYLNSRQLKSYWKDINVRDKHLDEIYRSPISEDLLHHFISGKYYEDLFTDFKFAYEELIAKNITSDKAIAIKYLFSAGYLSIRNTSASSIQSFYSYTIPNEEVLNYLKKVYEHISE